MEKLCSGHVRANRLSTLAQAADCLAKAAVTLSEAARAAAEAFSSEVLDISSELNLVSEAAHGRGPGDGSEHEECTNPEDTDYFLSDDGGEERAGNSPMKPTVDDTQNNIVYPCSTGSMAIDQLQFDPSRPPPVTSVTTTEIETVAGLAYRILVDHEADVLLFVCGLIQNRRKVICYMNCSIPTFHMYKRFINDVTTTDVYTITKITNAEITEVGRKFLEADRSILLLPETTTPSIEIDEIDSWVVHVGWPSDEQRYEEQRLIHQAQNSIIVACSEDEEMYPAGAAIMWQSQPWPGDVDSFRVSVALLRPIFEQKLSLLPAEMKAKVYPDWIGCHGPRGHRHVKAWDAATLVQRANSFLLDVLKYKAPGSKEHDLDTQASLPEVSEGFMVHNGLQIAAQQGLLRVKIPGSGLNHVSSLPTIDWEPVTDEEPVNDWAMTEWGPAEPITCDWEMNTRPLDWSWGSPGDTQDTPPSSRSRPPPATGLHYPSRSSYFNYQSPAPSDNTNNVPVAPIPSTSRASQLQFGSIMPQTANFSLRERKFKPMPGHTYFTIDEEFQAIPLMCFLANTCEPTLQNAVFFFDISGCQTQYRTLIERVTGWEVFVPENTENKQAIEDTAIRFIRFQGRAILMLPSQLNTVPSSLKNVSLGYCVYWGSTLRGFVPLLQAKKNKTILKCEFTSIIMTTTQAEKIATHITNSDFNLHPSSVDLIRENSSPWFSASLSATRSTLHRHPELVQEIYEAHLRSVGKALRSLGPKEIAQRINRYTANVLLTGDLEDGSNKYLPIAGRPTTPLSIIQDLKLQAAVDAGILYV
ncbi:hypothetical protein OPQ81_002585 [Rhizoctonia solani]|nr:hypothetical protein OPQ81_002585 [Rhizoctonia solani]